MSRSRPPFAAVALDTSSLETAMADAEASPMPMTERSSVRGLAQSASPRPPRWRPVDTVRLAKHELAQAKQAKIKLALANVDVMDREPHPPHEAFYDMAAAVVRPHLTAREHALQLSDELEAKLRSICVVYVNPGGAPGASDEPEAEPRQPRDVREYSGKGSAKALQSPAVRRGPGALPSPRGGRVSPRLSVSGGASVGTVATVVSGATLVKVSEGSCKQGGMADRGTHERRIQEMHQSKLQAEVCGEILDRYAKETTTDCRERVALLERVRYISNVAIQRLCSIAQTSNQDTRDAQEVSRGFELSLTALQEERNEDQHRLQELMVTEAQLRTKNNLVQYQAEELQESLNAAERRIEDLNSQLSDTVRELTVLRAGQELAKDTRDACHSPMMGFASFTLAPDQVPPPPVNLSEELEAMGAAHVKASKGDKASGGAKKDAKLVEVKISALDGSTASGSEAVGIYPVSASGHGPETLQLPNMPLRRASFASNAATGAGGDMSRSKPRDRAKIDGDGLGASPDEPFRANSWSFDPSEEGGARKNSRSRGDSQRCTAGFPSSAGNSRAASPQGRDASSAGVPGSAGIGIAVSLNLREALSSTTPSVFTATGDSTALGLRNESPGSDASGEQEGKESAFPILIPFLDFSHLDPDLALSTSHAAALNQEHLEKHLAQTQEDYDDQVTQCERLQASVDSLLQRFLIWVQAIHDSLMDLSSNAVEQDISALAVLRDAVKWLAEGTCQDWTTPPGSFDFNLETYEKDIRGHLSKEHPSDVEVEDLRRALAHNRSRVEELQDQLLQARASVSGVRHNPQRKGPSVEATPRSGAASTAHRNTSSFVDFGGASSHNHVGVQCETAELEPLSGSSALAAPLSSTPRNRSMASAQDLSANDAATTATQRALNINNDHSSSLPISPSQSATTLDAGVIEGTAKQARQAAPTKGGTPSIVVETQHMEESNDLDAVASLDRETKRMRFLSAEFVQAIDYTVLPYGSASFGQAFGATAVASVKSATTKAGKSNDHEDKLGVTQLKAFMQMALAAKKTDDQRKDKDYKPRRSLHAVLQELLRRQHGIKKVVNQKSWQLVEAILEFSSTDKLVAIFAEFLDGTRDLDELSFYLYCSTVFTTSIFEDAGALPPARLPEGHVHMSRAKKMIEMLFNDLHKALSVLQVELEKRAKLLSMSSIYSSMNYEDFANADLSRAEEPQCVTQDDLLELLLEGWRMYSLILDTGNAKPCQFSWRKCVLAFLQSDVSHRGWLLPYEVAESEGHRLDLPGAEGADASGLRSLDETSLGLFVFRAVRRCGFQLPGPAAPASDALAITKQKQKNVDLEECLKIGRTAFESVEKTLAVYLTWLMHSEELRDLALFSSVKARIYGFRQAIDTGDVARGMFNFRSLMLLLLAHQFDLQYEKAAMTPQHLDTELRSLLRILRESWRVSSQADCREDMIEILGQESDLESDPGR